MNESIKKDRRQTHSRRSLQGGYTLAEMLTALFIFLVLLSGVSVLISAIYGASKQQSASLSNQFQATEALSNFTSELRNAATGNDGSFSLNQAGDNQIIFYTSLYGTNGAVPRIRYYRSGNTIYKGIVIPTGTPLTYNLGAEVVTPVETNIANGTTPVFTYYDGNYAGTSTPLVQPVNLNAVRYVQANFIILREPGVSTSTYAVTAGVTIRNLKTNLGN